MKPILFFIVCLSFPAILFAAPGAKWRDSTISDPKIKMRTEAVLNSSQGNYVLRITKNHATTDSPENTDFRMTEPGAYGNFTALVSFFDLNVNGIPLRLIELSRKNLTERNGVCSMELDFDGTLFRLDWYMTDSSPLLFGKLTHISGEIKSCKIKIDAGPNGFLLEPNGKLIFESGQYQRRAQTATRLLEGRGSSFVLTPAERWIVFFDTLKGTGKRTKAGPCLVGWTPESLKMVETRIPNKWSISLFFTLKPDFNTFEFALWQTANPAFPVEKVVDLVKSLQRPVEKK